MTVKVRLVGVDKVRIGLRGLKNDLTISKPEMRRFLRILGRKGRDIARRQITTQGGGSWAKLSKWTRAKTGRQSALVTERNRITFRSMPKSVEVVYAERSSDWNLTKHHKGFTTTGFSGKKVVIPLKNPSALKIKGNSITILSARPSVIPARNVWGTQGQHQLMARKESAIFMRRIIAKRVR